MSHWCESCGQRLPEGSPPADATWLGEPGDDHVHTFTRPAGTRKSGGEKKVLAVLAVVALLWGAFVALGRVVTPDDSIDDEVAADLEAERIEREVARALAEAEAEREAALEAEELSAAVDEADAEMVQDAEPEAAEILIDSRAPSVQVERLQRQLTRRSSEAVVAYRSEAGIVLIDLVTGEARIHVPAESFRSPAPGSVILRSGAASFAIDPESLVVRQVSDDSSLVINETVDGNTYFVDARALSGQASIVEVVSDGEYSFHRMPAGGAQLLAVDGLGLLAVPKGPTGETLIATIDSFEVFRPNRVLTGTAATVLEQQCEAENSCSLVITDLESETQTSVPSNFVRFGDQYALAPDGHALLRYSPEGFSEMFAADDESIAWIVGAGMSAPAWGPESNLIAWLDRLGDPTLKIMFPDERDWLSIDLRDFGAPAPIGPELIVFAPDAD